MHKFLFRTALSLCAALCLHQAYAAADAPAAASDTPASALSPVQARQALDNLQDPQRRAAMESTLRVLAAPSAGEASSASGASGAVSDGSGVGAKHATHESDSAHHAETKAAPAPKVAASAAHPATPAMNPLVAAIMAPSGATAASATAASSPLVSNGLIAQLVHQTSHWGRSAVIEAKGASGLFRGFPAIATWLNQVINSPDQRAQTWNALWTLAAVMLAALIGEWVLSRVLRHPRRLLAARAERDDKMAADIAASSQPELAADAQRDAADNATLKAEDRTRAAMVADVAPDADATPAAKTVAPEAPAAAGADQPDSADAADKREKVAATQVKGLISASSHWHLLKRLPAILAHFVLTLLPLIAFFLIATTLPSLLVDDGSVADNVIETITNAYLVVRTVLTIVRLLTAPEAPGLRLLQISDHTAHRLQVWMMWIVGIIVLGNGLADAVAELGMSNAAHDAISRLAVLIGHILAIVVVMRYRRPINRVIRRRTETKPSMAMLGAWLADIWAFVAIFLIVALWFSWALNVKNGLSRVFDLLGQSVAILAVARIIAIILLGALARAFNRGDDPAELSPVVRRAHRYYPALRRVVSTLVALITVVIMLQAWGVDSLHWFSAGAIGKSLISAGTTVGIACVVALLIWESTNAMVERRLDRWTQNDDRIRAARLRTLLPMLRSVLLIVIALIVGMTALNQLGVNTAPLLASASIIGVALGFGSQKLVQDFITGIFLLMENAMQVGDNVTVAGVSGTVEYLSIRTVRLRGGDGSLYTIPFSSVTTVNNTNRGIGNAAVKVSVAYDADIDLVVATLRDIGTAMRVDPAYADMILNDFEYWGIDVVEGAMVTISGQIRAKDSTRWTVQREFNRRILQRFREQGIPIADTQRRAYLTLDPKALQAEQVATEPLAETDSPAVQEHAKSGDNAPPK